MKKTTHSTSSGKFSFSLLLLRSKGQLFYILTALLLMVVLTTQFGCGKEKRSVGPPASDDCGEVDSVKNALPAEISAYIYNSNNNPGADYFLELNNIKYKGITNTTTDWVLFPSLPNGTFTCTWLVSGCTYNGGSSEEKSIDGPIQVTIQ